MRKAMFGAFASRHEPFWQLSFTGKKRTIRYESRYSEYIGKQMRKGVHILC